MRLSIFTGNAHPTLAQSVCNALEDDAPVGKALVTTFSNGEIRVRLDQSVRGQDVFIIQPTIASGGRSPNDALMELLLMVDAAKGAEAATVTAVIPCFGYARQDRRRGREPISSRLVCDMLRTAGVDRVLTVDLHATQIEGFFKPTKVTNLYASKALEDVLKRDYMGATIVSPDAGGAERARAYAKIVGGKLAIIDKRRPGPNEAEIEHIIGDVAGDLCLMVDDLIDTAGSVGKGASALMKAGAIGVDVMATHGVFSGQAAKNLVDSPITRVRVTNTCPLSPEIMATGKVESVTIADLLADAISRIVERRSLSRFTKR